MSFGRILLWLLGFHKKGEVPGDSSLNRSDSEPSQTACREETRCPGENGWPALCLLSCSLKGPHTDLVLSTRLWEHWAVGCTWPERLGHRLLAECLVALPQIGCNLLVASVQG